MLRVIILLVAALHTSSVYGQGTSTHEGKVSDGTDPSSSFVYGFSSRVGAAPRRGGKVEFAEIDERVLTKWKAPIRYFVDADDLELKQQIDQMMFDIGVVSTHPISRVESVDEANFFLIIGLRGPQVVETYSDMIDVFEDNGSGMKVVRGVISNPPQACLGLRKRDETKDHIGQAAIIFTKTIELKLRIADCLNSQMPGNLGFAGEKLKKTPAPLGLAEPFTALEKDYLRALYDPSIKSGATIRENMKALQKLAGNQAQ